MKKYLFLSVLYIVIGCQNRTVNNQKKGSIHSILDNRIAHVLRDTFRFTDKDNNYKQK